ncbi:hypothetical protein Acr_07g0013430 [Actinidia rufa]|uniref:BED-type domain-containing protein n=1 Tax=Actinidia rufa TaxID=165716 RepID=A0A7J0EZT9_9ERIC|nr:hypothetical protein Acr_07g0013430 [Actinidia rufa]
MASPSDMFDFSLNVHEHVRALEGTSNPVVMSILGCDDANFVNIEDDMVEEVPNPTQKQKRKLPPKEHKPKKEKYTSPCWDHFNKLDKDGVRWAECKYCQKQYAADSKKHGISNLKLHVLNCKLYPYKERKGQSNLSLKPTGEGGVDVVTSVFSFDAYKRALAELVVIDELPFRFVEGIGFRNFCKVMQSMFGVISRQTITREVVNVNKKIESCLLEWNVDGLSENSESILRVRDVVRYNSTYLILEMAEKFEKAFQRMAEEDNGFQTYFGVMEGEECEDGDDGTPIQRQRGSKFSASIFVTSNTFFDEIISIEMAIAKLIKNYDPLLSQMALNMQKKFDKYWGWNGGKNDNINFLVYVAVVLDPRFKLRWVKFYLDKSKGVEVGEAMEKLVKSKLNELYDAYAKESEVRVEAPIATPTPTVVVDDDLDVRSSLYNEFDTFCDQEFSSACSLEVDKYLVELCERKENPSFDILLWWKTNSNKYPILAQIACDVLALPVSTVASESAFSTGSRILDPFRSSLSPSIVETLVCTQN